jgi:hypothetical protein
MGSAVGTQTKNRPSGCPARGDRTLDHFSDAVSHLPYVPRWDIVGDHGRGTHFVAISVCGFESASILRALQRTSPVARLHDPEASDIGDIHYMLEHLKMDGFYLFKVR